MNGLVWRGFPRTTVSTAGIAFVSAHLGRLSSWRGHADYGNHRGFIASGACQRTVADPSVVSVSRKFHQSGLLDGLRLRIPCHSVLWVVLGLQVASRAGAVRELSFANAVDEA